MGRPITVQKRGKGSSTYRAPSHRYEIEIKHRKYGEKEVVRGMVVDMFRDPARSAPVAAVRFKDGKKMMVIATEGMKVGDEVSFGTEAGAIPGNTLALGNIPEGTPVNNIENLPGGGGQFVRASGAYGLIISHGADSTLIQLPSGELKNFNSKCRATIGIIAGGGRKDKPILKAGKMWHMLNSKSKYWPIVRKVAMNPVDHPHGGGSRRPGRPTSVSRNAPPGQKVGLISPRRTGRK